MKKYKYTAKFNFSPTLVSVSKFNTIASTSNLKKLLPESSSENLLYIAGDGYVANLCNANDDCVDKETSIKMASTFIDKPINLEHSEYDIKGHIKTFGYSSFGDSRMLEEEDLEDYSIFNVCFGGVIYKTSDKYFASLLKMSDDESSELYQLFSFSFEVGFDDFNIVVGNTNLAKADKIISGDDRKNYEKYLRAFGGGGFTPEGDKVYRVIAGDAEGLGLGIVTNPAASVKGILVSEGKNNKKEEESEIFANFQEKKQENQESQEKSRVNYNEQIVMKFTSIAEIIENKDKVTASALKDFIADQVSEKSKEWEKQLEDEKNSKNSVEARVSELEESVKQLEKTVSDKDSQVATLEAEIQKRDADEVFNTRMEELDTEFNLDDEAKKVVATQIKDLDSEQYKTWKDQFSVFASKFDKKEKAGTKEENSLEENLEDVKETKCKSVASSVNIKILDEKTFEGWELGKDFVISNPR